MKKIIQIRTSKGDTHYVAECLDLPIVTQGKTLDELKENIEEALTLHLEGETLARYDHMPEHEMLARLGAASRQRGMHKLSLLKIEEEISTYRKEKREANGKGKARA
jgi:predicted RNase H-like HicB family nuclease